MPWDTKKCPPTLKPLKVFSDGLTIQRVSLTLNWSRTNKTETTNVKSSNHVMDLGIKRGFCLFWQSSWSHSVYFSLMPSFQQSLGLVHWTVFVPIEVPLTGKKNEVLFWFFQVMTHEANNEHLRVDVETTFQGQKKIAESLTLFDLSVNGVSFPFIKSISFV